MVRDFALQMVTILFKIKDHGIGIGSAGINAQTGFYIAFGIIIGGINTYSEILQDPLAERFLQMPALWRRTGILADVCN